MLLLQLIRTCGTRVPLRANALEGVAVGVLAGAPLMRSTLGRPHAATVGTHLLEAATLLIVPLVHHMALALVAGVAAASPSHQASSSRAAQDRGAASPSPAPPQRPVGI